MDKETLTCTNCGSTWNRQKARGRKPQICPACVADQNLLKDSDSEEEPQDLVPVIVSEPPPSESKYKPGSKWKCHSCLAKVQIGVGINEPPTHRCPKRLKKLFALEQI